MLADPMQYAQLFEQSPLAIGLYDRDLRLVDVNERLVTILRSTREKLIGLDLADLADRRLPLEVFRRPLAGEPSTYEGAYATTTSGHELVISLRVIPLRDAAEMIVGGAVYLEEVTAQRQTEASLRELERRTRVLFKGLPIPTYAWQVRADGELVLVDYNDAAVTITGGTIPSFLGFTLTKMFGDSDIARDIRRCWAERIIIRRFAPHTFRSGVTKQLWATYSPVPPDLVIVHTEDATERMQLEEDLRQAQKMNAVGRLAGGIAHDFNNLLTVVSSCAAFLSAAVDAQSALREDIEQIQKAAERAAELTRQLLAFSRKQVLQPRNVDLNAVVAGTHGMLRRLIGEDVQIELRLDPALGRTRVDPGQMEQVIVNLAINARDAMEQGGTLTVATANVELDEDEARRRGVAPGAYVQLTVTDTGKGMDEETRGRAFEPFFSTKDAARGAGLGLATVYGIVHQSAGNVRIESEPGRGSTFVILLPREAPGDAEPVSSLPPPRDLARGSGIVLLVEDDAAVRSVCRRMLQRLGYTVLEADCGRAALETEAALAGTIDLLITDMVMPDLNGRRTAEALRARRPGLPVLFVTGYTDDVVLREDGIALLRKPFTEQELSNAIQSVAGTGRRP